MVCNSPLHEDCAKQQIAGKVGSFGEEFSVYTQGSTCMKHDLAQEKNGEGQFCQLPVLLPVAGCQLPVAGCQLPVAGCRLPVAG